MKTLYFSDFDGILSHFFKATFPIFSHPLCKISILSIESEVFPDNWKLARVALSSKEIQLKINRITNQSVPYLLFQGYLKSCFIIKCMSTVIATGTYLSVIFSYPALGYLLFTELIGT